MDPLRALVTAPGCAVDGSAAAANPVASLVHQATHAAARSVADRIAGSSWATDPAASGGFELVGADGLPAAEGGGSFPAAVRPDGPGASPLLARAWSETAASPTASSRMAAVFDAAARAGPTGVQTHPAAPVDPRVFAHPATAHPLHWGGAYAAMPRHDPRLVHAASWTAPGAAFAPFAVPGHAFPAPMAREAVAPVAPVSSLAPTSASTSAPTSASATSATSASHDASALQAEAARVAAAMAADPRFEGSEFLHAMRSLAAGEPFVEPTAHGGAGGSVAATAVARDGGDARASQEEARSGGVREAGPGVESASASTSAEPPAAWRLEPIEARAELEARAEDMWRRAFNGEDVDVDSFVRDIVRLAKDEVATRGNEGQGVTRDDTAQIANLLSEVRAGIGSEPVAEGGPDGIVTSGGVSEAEERMLRAWAEGLLTGDELDETAAWLAEAREGAGASSASSSSAAAPSVASAMAAPGATVSGSYMYTVPAAENAFARAVAAGSKSVAEAFQEGMVLWNEGRVADSVRAFEAVLQSEPEHAGAWLMMGKAHAELDDDQRAIQCLERAVEADPYSLEALLALGVSYVNEQREDLALANLRAWVQHNPRFVGLEVEDDPYADGTPLDDVMRLMLRAEAWAPADPDVQEVLGVLYNVSRNYDSAATAFSRALAQRSDSWSLWNKLGASLTNGRRPDEALPALRCALSLRPTYARAILNVGITNAQRKDYEEAARSYAQALALNPGSRHMWGQLRVAAVTMARYDLLERCDAFDLDGAARLLGVAEPVRDLRERARPR